MPDYQDFSRFSFKELYEVKLKSTQNIEVAGSTVEAGEVIADFDEIQIANFQEIKNLKIARGGFYNEPQIIWHDTKELQIDFIHGIFSKAQYALLTNSKIIKPETNHSELIGKREYIESDENGRFELTQVPSCDVYVYDLKTGFKFPRMEDVENAPYWKYNGNKELQIVGNNEFPVDYKDLVVDYCYSYTNATSIIRVGKEFTNNFLWLEGKTRVKYDETGLVKTGIIRIPKLKLMSDLSIRVGKQANPQVGYFKAIAYPTGSQGNKEVMRMIFLEDDIDSDM